MRWEKLGLIYAPSNLHPKLCTHAANPLPVHLEGDVYRIFFSGRDRWNRSSVGFTDVDVLRREVVGVCSEPAFSHGPPGSFFSHGVSIGNCYSVGPRRYMLFMGWHAPQGGHWRGEIGRLLVSDDLSLSLDGTAPFVALTAADPISLSYPYVLPAAEGHFDMWYGSTLSWDAGNGEMLHVLKHRRSFDGDRFGEPDSSLPSEIGVAQAFSRPSVVRTPSGGAEMWFSYRSGMGETYRIGYARMEKGQSWSLRLAAAGIDVSPAGWDSEMIEYPYVFDHAGQRFMLYNGNGYGLTGFGLAVLDA